MTNDEWRYDRVLRFTALLSLTIGRFYPQAAEELCGPVRFFGQSGLYSTLYKHARLYYALPFDDHDWAHLVHMLAGSLMRIASPTLGELDNEYRVSVDAALEATAETVALEANSSSRFILAYDLNGEGTTEAV